MMKTLMFLSQKGGSGKTTLAVHVAVAAAAAARSKIAVFDLDPQGSATVWGEARQGAAPIVLACGVAGLPRALDAARADGVTLAILDTAPHASADAAKMARLSSLVVVPVRPTAFDLAAVEAAARIVLAAKARAVLVLSACPVRAPEIAEARAALLGFGLPVCPVLIHDRRAYSRAIASGKAVTEFDAGGKAAAEIRALWLYLKGYLK